MFLKVMLQVEGRFNIGPATQEKDRKNFIPTQAVNHYQQDKNIVVIVSAVEKMGHQTGRSKEERGKGSGQE